MCGGTLHRANSDYDNNVIIIHLPKRDNTIIALANDFNAQESGSRKISNYALNNFNFCLNK